LQAGKGGSKGNGKSVSPSPYPSPHRVEGSRSFFSPMGRRWKMRGKEHPNSPSTKGWQAKPDGVVADTPLTITSPLGGEDEGEGENTPSANQTPLYERGIDRTEKGVNQPSHMEKDAKKNAR